VQSITAFETVRAFIDNTADVPETVFSAVAWNFMTFLQCVFLQQYYFRMYSF